MDPSIITSSETKQETYPGFSDKELIWWEINILWSLKQYENPNRLLNILDIVAALVAFKHSAHKYSEKILLKWLKSYLGSKFEISPTLFSEAPKLMPMLSSRQLHLLNIIIRRVVLKEFMTENVSVKESVLEEGLSDDKKEQMKLWKDLLSSCENELRLRLVSISFSGILSLPSNSSEEFGCSPETPNGSPQMEQWFLQNVKDCSKFLAAESRKVKKRYPFLHNFMLLLNSC